MTCLKDSDPDRFRCGGMVQCNAHGALARICSLSTSTSDEFQIADDGEILKRLGMHKCRKQVTFYAVICDVFRRDLLSGRFVSVTGRVHLGVYCQQILAISPFYRAACIFRTSRF